MHKQHEQQSLEQAYQSVQDLIPDYDWTTIIKSGDLIHIPTKTVLSCDIDGYYLTNTMMYDPILGDHVSYTTDPALAVTSFVVEVIRQLCQERLEN